MQNRISTEDSLVKREIWIES